MKIIILLSFTFLLLVGCSPDNPPTPQTSSFKFKISGATYQIDGVRVGDYEAGSKLSKQCTSCNYLLEASNASTNLIAIGFELSTNTLVNGVYQTVDMGFKINGNSYGEQNRPVDSYIVTITNINGEYASGIFTATLSNNANASDIINITEGQFTNVKILN